MTRPEVTAILDQAGAAQRDADATMHAIATLDGGQLEQRHPGPITRTMILKLQTRALRGQVKLCAHLSYTAPAVAFWAAWAPKRLRCAPCAAAAAQRLHGTPEDRRCDHCRRLVEAIHPDGVGLPPVVVDLRPLPLGAVPPIIVAYGLCPDCHRADRQPPGLRRRKVKR